MRRLKVVFVLSEPTAERSYRIGNWDVNITFEVSRRVTQRLSSWIMKILLTEVLGYRKVVLVERDENFLLEDVLDRLYRGHYDALQNKGYVFLSFYLFHFEQSLLKIAVWLERVMDQWYEIIRL